MQRLSQTYGLEVSSDVQSVQKVNINAFAALASSGGESMSLKDLEARHQIEKWSEKSH